MRISDWSSDVCSSDLAYGSTQCDAYCVGYQLDNEAHNITYNRVEAHHFQESGTAASKYWNGDGFSDERGNHGIRYLTCTATECTDGGFDLKSTDVYMENCVSRANKRSEEHTSELQSLKRISYAVFCLKKTTKKR